MAIFKYVQTSKILGDITHNICNLNDNLYISVFGFAHLRKEFVIFYSNNKFKRNNNRDVCYTELNTLKTIKELFKLGGYF